MYIMVKVVKSCHIITLLPVFGEGVSLLHYLMIMCGQRREMLCLLLKMLMPLLLVLIFANLNFGFEAEWFVYFETQ